MATFTTRYKENSLIFIHNIPETDFEKICAMLNLTPNNGSKQEWVDFNIGETTITFSREEGKE